jgi:hypothetical protein
MDAKNTRSEKTDNAAPDINMATRPDLVFLREPLDSKV